jgi:hypothetical protein
MGIHPPKRLTVLCGYHQVLLPASLLLSAMELVFFTSELKPLPVTGYQQIPAD